MYSYSKPWRHTFIKCILYLEANGIEIVKIITLTVNIAEQVTLVVGLVGAAQKLSIM